jgi:trimeric autotransporter adhesin
VAKPSYAQERYSVQIGGPLMFPKLFRFDKTTFNFNYTSNRSDNLRTQIGTVPTLLERTGDFSLSNRIVYNPVTHAPFSDNKIPTGMLNPIALGLLNFFPKPNQTGSCAASNQGACSAQNFQFTDVVPNNNQSVGLRLGQSIGQKDRLALNFQYQNRSSITPQIFGFLDSGSGSGYNTSLNWIHTFAPRIFNMATVSFNRNRNDSLPFFANGADIAAQLGILGTSGNPLNFGPPNLSFTNFAGLTDGSASFTRIQTVGLNEVFTWMRGKHTISTGALFQRNQNNVKTDSNGRGSFSFSGLATSGLDANGQPLPATGYDLADFLLGLPNSDSIRFGDTTTYFRTTNYSFFGQDDWRMLPNFSINFGLRYEYYGVPSELYGREANLDIARYFTAVAQVIPGQAGPYTGDFPAGLVNPDRNNFAPRLGIAWRPWPKGKTVVRAGYGMYYNGAAYNSFGRNLAAQPPFANSNSVITSSAAVLTLASGFTVTPPGKTITNTFAVDRFYRIPYAQTWNFSIQQQLPHQLVLQVTYLGTKGTRLDTLRLPNRAAPGSPLTSEERRQIGNATGFTFESSDANSIYHSARVSLIRRFARGTSFNIDYIFAKSIDDAATFGGGLAQNDLDISAERSLSNFDHRHVLNVSYLFTSPFGHNSRWLAHRVLATKLLQDWTLNGGIHAQTGSPFTPRVAGNLSDSAGTGANGTTRPDATGLPITAGTGFFNTAAFILPLAGEFGDAGRNTIPGPGSVTLNASFGRAFSLGERRSLEFRFDANNILNHVNIASFGTTTNASNYGLPLAASAMRSMSVVLRFRF